MVAADAVPRPPPLPLDRLEAVSRARLGATDARYLLRAVELSRNGWGSVHPNPLVGCVLVREGEEVGRGWHRAFGEPHAEVEALRAAGGDAASGATAFVSLEPCTHRGKTPACTLALRRAGIARVVYGAADPTPEAGGGGDELRKAGLEVVGPIFPDGLARSLDPAFFHASEHPGSPYVALKLAVTLDGKIAAGEGERTAVSGEVAGRYTHRLRAGFGGILVGAGTVRTDDPLLTVRGDVTPRLAPHRLVVDSRAEALKPGAALLRDPDRAPVHLFCLATAPEDRTRALEREGVTVHRVPGAADGVELEAVLRVSREEGIGSILCEGGARLAGSLLRAGLARRLYLYLAPRTLNGGVAAFPEGLGAGAWAGWSSAGPGERLGGDVLVVFDRGGS